MFWKKTFNIIGNVITVLLFSLFIVTLVAVISARASGGEPDIFGYQLKTVLSGSMEPDIQTGSVISIKPGGDMTRFQEGDVITFQTKDGTLITHRIVDVKNGGQQYVTKGDNNDTVDPEPVLAENVVGEYTGFTIPYLGYVMNFASSKQGAVLLLIVPGVMLLIYGMATVWRTLRLIDMKEKESTAHVE